VRLPAPIRAVPGGDLVGSPLRRLVGVQRFRGGRPAAPRARDNRGVSISAQF
jgi:hypothetical protein